ncbi:hypothetical protein [Parvularcula maris]|uniref:Type ISP restriction-modification enzyme coupler domain-containing protein n=1 Tax=Parvularcula maris TaxID=2965077 RepID=A0A9X2L9S6_9PROT|nr:hypothetical protein [Parvularcula maris]MCQ8184762.1 hypothetical protein [Parvularcula maris]
MSVQRVQGFLNELSRLRQMAGHVNEQTIRPAFRDLLRDWCRSEELHLLEEHPHTTAKNRTVYPDGTIVHDLRVPHGYWEAKDTKDDLDEEIADKLRKGYPDTNIIYENAAVAVLRQNGRSVMRTDMTEPEGLSELLTLFFRWERPEIRDWRSAVRQFQADLPAVVEQLREQISAAYAANDDFRDKAEDFLDHARSTINPMIGEADIREMLIQHVLTEDIFNHVFNDSDFHRENNVAKTLYDLEKLFFRGKVKRGTLKALEPYYAAIRAAAASITSHC